MYVTSDPMLEHSRDLRVNSYPHRDCEPGYRMGQGEGVTTAVRPYCLAVRNIPAGLTRAGLANIFSQFGDLLECQLGGDRGKVAFSSGVQAAAAMAQLDRREPYGMMVDWQVDKEVREKRKVIEEEEKQFADIINKEFDQVVANNVKWNDELVKDTVEAGAHHFKEEKELKTVGIAKSPKPNFITSSSPHYWCNQPLSLPPPTTAGLCCRCSGPGLLLCSACSAWYCSQLCQAEHWPRHKHHCIHNKPLERGVGEEEKEDREQMMSEEDQGGHSKTTTETVNYVDEENKVVSNPKVSEEVVVSYLQSPTNLYLQSVQSLPLLSSMMLDLQSSQHHTSPTARLEQDTLYLAQCEGVWCRVQVVSISPSHSMARVFLVDYGNTDTVGVDNIKTLNIHEDVPAMAWQVKIVTRDEEEEWVEEELLRLREIVGEGEVVKFRLNEDDNGNSSSLEDGQGRNVLDVWRKIISLGENNCPLGKE